jgi:hypothetical protein
MLICTSCQRLCQIKLRSLQSIRLSTSTDRTKKASKVEKPSSRGVSYLHRWSLMLLQSSGSCPCALSAHMYVCLLLCVSTQLCVAATLLLLPRAGTHDSDSISASLLLHLDNINRRTNRIGDLTRYRVS